MAGFTRLKQTNPTENHKLISITPIVVGNLMNRRVHIAKDGGQGDQTGGDVEDTHSGEPSGSSSLIKKRALLLAKAGQPKQAYPMFRSLALLLALSLTPIFAADNYQLTTESTERADGVEKGDLTFFEFAESNIFKDTTRGCWLYVPKAYDGSEPAALMVFQDGHAYVSEDGQMRAPIVLDNLMASGAMPTTISVFVNPGHVGEGGAKHDSWGKRSNRSVEYDTLSANYATFLVDELLPHLTKAYNLKLDPRPERRAICGMSSGGICAWTVAWERPDQFGKVLSHIGSFTNIRGGHVYPALIRKTERKPIRVFLQDGSNDLNNRHGNWPLANLQMAQALAFAGYDHRFVYGDGAHNGKHGGAILPDSLRWLWRDWDAPKQSDAKPIDVSWEEVGNGYYSMEAVCTDPITGQVYFSDFLTGMLYRTNRDGRPALWLDQGKALRISGLDFGPDGAVYGAAQTKWIVRINPNDKTHATVATGLSPNDLVVSTHGHLYVTDTKAGTVNHVSINARNLSRPQVLAGGITTPAGIALNPDHTILFVSEFEGDFIWRFFLTESGELRGGERFAKLHRTPDKPNAGGDGMVVSEIGDLYVTSHAGIQRIDSSGKHLGVLPKPQDKPTVSVAIANGMLYCASADRVFKTPIPER